MPGFGTGRKTIDMTQGSILCPVILFSLPICIGNILQQMYNTVDTLIVGNFCSSVSLAAVGTSSQPVEFLLCIFLGIGSGISILISQAVGARDLAQQKRIIQSSVFFLFLCSFPLMLLGQFIGPAVLKFMQVPDDTWDLAVSYIRILFLGVLGNLGYNMNAGILRGLGDSNASLLFLLISCFVNIVLDYLFIAVFGTGVAGAAAATSIAMYISWFFSLFYLRRRYRELNFPILPKTVDKKILLDILKIGLPLGFNNSVYSIGHILLQSLVNAQGSVFMASCAVATKITSIAGFAQGSFAQAATTFSGQNAGAGNYDRLKKGVIKIPLISGILTLSFALILLAFCRPVLSLFTKEEDVLYYAVRYIQLVLPSCSFFAVFNAIISFVNGSGEIRYPTIVNILMLWAVRIPCAHLITRFWDGTYCMAAYPVSFAFGMFCMIGYLFTSKWKKHIHAIQS